MKRCGSEQELCMSNYLMIGGWSGPKKIPVHIVAETPEGYEIRVLERVYLPGRGLLKKGQLAFVPKRVVRVKDGEQTRNCAWKCKRT